MRELILSSYFDERSEIGGPSGARERETVAHEFAWAISSALRYGAAGSPGLRREGAACRRMTKGGNSQ